MKYRNTLEEQRQIQEKLNRLKDSEELIKIAREKYFLKKKNEQMIVIEWDTAQVQQSAE